MYHCEFKNLTIYSYRDCNRNFINFEMLYSLTKARVDSLPPMVVTKRQLSILNRNRVQQASISIL